VSGEVGERGEGRGTTYDNDERRTTTTNDNDE